MMALLKGGFRENFQTGFCLCTSRTNQYDLNYLLIHAPCGSGAVGFMYTITGSQGADDNGIIDYLGFSTTDLLTGKFCKYRPRPFLRTRVN